MRVVSLLCVVWLAQCAWSSMGVHKAMSVDIHGFTKVLGRLVGLSDLFWLVDQPASHELSSVRGSPVIGKHWARENVLACPWFNDTSLNTPVSNQIKLKAGLLCLSYSVAIHLYKYCLFLLHCTCSLFSSSFFTQLHCGFYRKKQPD